MANIYSTITVPFDIGIGTAIDARAMGITKTISLRGDQNGVVAIMGSCDSGTTYSPIASVNLLSHPSESNQQFSARITVLGFFDHLRIDRTMGNGTLTASVSAENVSIASYFSALDVPLSTGVGVALDTTDYPQDKTFLVSGSYSGRVIIEGSTDGGVTYNPITYFTTKNSEVQTTAGVYNRIRVRRESVITKIDGTPTPPPTVAIGSGQRYEQGGTYQIENVVALRAYEPSASETSTTFYLRGYATPGDGGEGSFRWNSTSVAADDGGTIFAVAGVATGRWIRVYEGDINPRWFGATGDGVTTDTVAIQNAVAAATAATVNLRFTAGTYIYTSAGVDTTFATTFGVTFDKGAIFQFSGLGSMSWASNIEAGNYQIWNAASGKIVFATGFASEVNPMWWGASPSAAAATNVTAINSSTASLLASYAKWRLPEGQFTTNALITFSTLSQAVLTFDGAILNDTTSGVKFTSITRSKIDGLTVLRTSYDWADDEMAVIFDCYFQQNYVYIKNLFGFRKGIDCDSNSALADYGIGYNEIHIGRILDCQYGIYVHNSNLGWCNDNEWFGGAIRLTAAVKAATSGTWGAYFSWSVGLYIYSNHRFYAQSFEILHGGMYMASGCYNFLLSNPRFEVVDTWANLTSAQSFTWSAGIAFDRTKVLTSSFTRGFTITSVYDPANTSAQRSIVMDAKFGGLTFVEPTDMPTNSASHLWVDNINVSAPRFDSYLGPVQKFNKQFEGSAAPSTGTFQTNAVVWNTSFSTDQPLGWICSALGTQGTLSGVTGTIATGSTTLAVNMLSGLKVGQFLRMTADGGGYALYGHEVLGISGMACELNTGALQAGTAKAVTYHPATFTTLPRYYGPTAGMFMPSGLPSFLGQEYLHIGTVPPTLYKAMSTTNMAGWVRISEPNPQLGNGSPSGAVNPRFVGDKYLDQVGLAWYSNPSGLSSSSWLPY